MKIAVYTIVKNEQYFLPLWLKYYSKYFEHKDIYILDNGSTDNSTQDLKCNVILKPTKKTFDLDWLLNTVHLFQKELLKKYDYVLFTEVDEIVCPVEHNGFDGFITATKKKKSYKCCGYEVVHMYDNEPEINLKKGLIEQRSKWYKSGMYSKTILTSIPLKYKTGFHISNYSTDVSDGLFLIHLHKIDLTLAIKRNVDRLDNTVSKVRQGWQNYTTDETIIKKYFTTYFEAQSLLEDIPEKYKKII